MKTKKIVAAGIFLGGLLTASATVTAISITGTLDFRALIPGAADLLGIDDADFRVTVTPGPSIDDDDSGPLAGFTLLDPAGEERAIEIFGSDSLDGTYSSFVPFESSSLHRLADRDQLFIGGGQFTRDTGGHTLRLAGITLDFPAGTFDGPDPFGELVFPNNDTPVEPLASDVPADDDLVVLNDNGEPVAAAALNPTGSEDGEGESEGSGGETGSGGDGGDVPGNDGSPNDGNSGGNGDGDNGENNDGSGSPDGQNSPTSSTDPAPFQIGPALTSSPTSLTGPANTSPTIPPAPLQAVQVPAPTTLALLLPAFAALALRRRRD